MEDKMKALSKFTALVVAKIPYVFGNLTLAYTPSRQVSACWYKSNGAYRFPVGSRIYVPRWRGAYGYGIRAEGVVIGHKNRTDISGEIENRYIVAVTTDSTGDWNRWCKEGYVDPDAKRVTQTEIHFKWNLENQWAYSVLWYVRLRRWVEEKFGIISDHNNNPSLY